MFSSRDSSTSIIFYWAGSSKFEIQPLIMSVESDLLKRHPNIVLKKSIPPINIQNFAVFYSYTSNNTIGVSAYLPFQNQKLRLDYEDQNRDGENEYDEFLSIVKSIVELNDY